MTLFSSRPPFNDDPEPWECTAPDFERYANEWDYEGRHAVVHGPRPEYDRPQHNPTNPILTEFRDLHEQTGNDLWTDAYLSWSDLIEQEWVTKDEYWHAFTVLGKIVSMGWGNR